MPAGVEAKLASYISFESILLRLRITPVFFLILLLPTFGIGVSAGIVPGHAAVDLGLHDTYSVTML